jgi:7-keto-8-aminopelargonate synthetase-like enzyme
MLPLCSSTDLAAIYSTSCPMLMAVFIATALHCIFYFTEAVSVDLFQRIVYFNSENQTQSFSTSY